jgi:hypothetical protein
VHSGILLETALRSVHPLPTMNLNEAVLKSTPFQMGVKGIIAEFMTEDDKKEFYGDKVWLLYSQLPDSVKAEVSLDAFYRISPDSAKTAALLKENTFFIETFMTQIETIEKLTKESAIFALVNLPMLVNARPAEINGCLEAATWQTPRTSKLDPWEYCVYGRLNQSYQSCQSRALFSTATVNELTGDSVHFMMFQRGLDALECRRFSFGDSALDGDPQATGTRREIPLEFLDSLGLDRKFAHDLREYVLRLDQVQEILNVEGQWNKCHTQTLFQHILSSVISIIDEGTNDIPCRVLDVTGMAEIEVMVEVCKEYINSQNKAGTPVHAGRPTRLRIKTDLVVESLNGKSGVRLTAEELKRATLFSNYIIEMKKAKDYLRNSSVKQKSQLIGESLARHKALERGGPNALFSVLTDCCSLYVLVHFRDQKQAYLSRREIEPGRIIGVLVWLHTISKRRNDLTLKEFLESGFVIGEKTLDAEIADTVNAKKRSRSIGSRSNQSRSDDGGTMQHDTKSHDILVLDVSAADEKEKRDAEIAQLATFSAFQNHYHFGCDLPLTDGVMKVLRAQEGTNQEDSIQRMHKYAEIEPTA